MLPDKRPRLRALVSRAVLWTGLVVIGVIAVPAGLLFGLIALIWDALNFLLRKIDNA